MTRPLTPARTSPGRRRTGGRPRGVGSAVVLVATVLLSVALLLWAGPVVGQGRAPVDSSGGAVRPVTGAVIKPFIPPEHPYGPGHRGVDLTAMPGSIVRAALSGTVAFAGLVAGTGWLTIRHGGSLVTTYGDVRSTVAEGDDVSAGQVVAHLADGASHLDWGARLDGAYIDPRRLLGVWRLRLADPASVPTGRPVRVDPAGRTGVNWN